MSQEAALDLALTLYTLQVPDDQWLGVAATTITKALTAAEQRAYRRAAEMVRATCNWSDCETWPEENRCEVHKLAAQLEAEGAESCPTCGDPLPCAKAACTMARMPVIDDPAVSEALRDLEDDEGAES